MEEQAAFKARQAERDAVADSKTSKNRAKRQKRKNGRKGEGGKEGSAEAVSGEKRKLAGGGAGVVFKRPGDEDESDEAEEEEVGPELVPVVPEVVEVPKVVEETKIIIHDD